MTRSRKTSKRSPNPQIKKFTLRVKLCMEPESEPDPAKDQLRRKVLAWLFYQSRSSPLATLEREFLLANYSYTSLDSETLEQIKDIFASVWKEWDASPRRKRKIRVKRANSESSLSPVKTSIPSLHQKDDDNQSNDGSAKSHSGRRRKHLFSLSGFLSTSGGSLNNSIDV